MSTPPDLPAALGRDPFESDDDFDPFITTLTALERARSESAPNEPTDRSFLHTPDPQPVRSHLPELASLEVPPERDWIDRFINPEDRRRLAALAALADGEAYDRFGLSPESVRQAFPFFHSLYVHYFRVQSSGHEHVPASGPVVIACNHAGLLPFDAAMLALDLFLHSDPPRLPRCVVERWAGNWPWLNILFARLGQVVGTSNNVEELLDDGQPLLVFPEGVAGAVKPLSQRYRLQRFRLGFVEQALRAGAPILPAAVIGSDDQSPILFDLRPLARLLGLPAAPITPTFPLLGPLGLLPYPARYRIVYGEPFDFHLCFGAEEAENTTLVRDLSRRVRREVQRLLDRNR